MPRLVALVRALFDIIESTHSALSSEIAIPNILQARLDIALFILSTAYALLHLLHFIIWRGMTQRIGLHKSETSFYLTSSSCTRSSTHRLWRLLSQTLGDIRAHGTWSHWLSHSSLFLQPEARLTSTYFRLKTLRWESRRSSRLFSWEILRSQGEWNKDELTSINYFWRHWRSALDITREKWWEIEWPS